MNILKKKSNDYIIIIGCGRLGANLADYFSDNGIAVTIIDSNKDSFRKLSPSYGGLTLLGDVTDMNIFEQANPQKATAVICVTNSDNTNVLVAQMAKEIYKINHVVARLYDPERECVYKEFDIETICPSVLSANAISQLINTKSTTEAAI